MKNYIMTYCFNFFMFFNNSQSLMHCLLKKWKTNWYNILMKTSNKVRYIWPVCCHTKFRYVNYLGADL